MSAFDTFFVKFFKHYKGSNTKRANTIALVYLTLLQSALVLLFGVLLAGFLDQMNVDTMSSKKAWSLFVILVGFIYFKNWMTYNGKKRMILNAKLSKKKTLNYPITMLWLLPFALIGLAIIILQAV
ncbi:hypothetical protein [Lacinutrix salivirga]